mmetsp:Transcript_38670/g.93500  ORF Transcript_38670/g.93500 Transcript_38670/m.93500 type:complete len:81 (+) Transcript_38670:1202-1444(+)
MKSRYLLLPLEIGQTARIGQSIIVGLGNMTVSRLFGQTVLLQTILVVYRMVKCGIVAMKGGEDYENCFQFSMNRLFEVLG